MNIRRYHNDIETLQSRKQVKYCKILNLQMQRHYHAKAFCLFFLSTWLAKFEEHEKRCIITKIINYCPNYI